WWRWWSASSCVAGATCRPWVEPVPCCWAGWRCMPVSARPWWEAYGPGHWSAWRRWALRPGGCASAGMARWALVAGTAALAWSRTVPGGYAGVEVLSGAAIGLGAGLLMRLLHGH